MSCGRNLFSNEMSFFFLTWKVFLTQSSSAQGNLTSCPVLSQPTVLPFLSFYFLPVLTLHILRYFSFSLTTAIGSFSLCLMEILT